MDDQNKNLLLATVLSGAVLLVWYLLVPPPEQPIDTQDTAQITETAPGQSGSGVASAPSLAQPAGTVAPQPMTQQDTTDLPRIAIDTTRLEGSILLQGGRIDDLLLKDYTETLDEGSPNVRVLDPVGSAQPYYALYGWAPGSSLTNADVPNAQTDWTIESGATLTEETPVTLRWDSPAGLTFRRTISVDEDFLFTVTQSVENAGDATVRLAPYGLLARHGIPADLQKFFVLHEGMIAMTDGILESQKYDKISDLDVLPSEGTPAEAYDVTSDGWIGFTDHYWMSTLISQPGQPVKQVVKYEPGNDIYQTRQQMQTVELAPGQSSETTSYLFSGAKEWETIQAYQNQPGRLASLMGAEADPSRPQIDRFVDAIDWGWFFFLTKPIFRVLHWLNATIGNMGVAIIVLTFMLKALLFPLARKSYISMAKMKELQPEMEKIKERAGDDREKLQKEMMALYKKEKVNPAAGCLPILMQVPIFFSLYKVIFVAFELRQASFFGPFQDLSTPDPTSIMNFFGLLPWAGPEAGTLMATIFIGILPLLLGVSMWLQQKLNPAPTDPAQAMIFAWMPWVFMFMLGNFASGLVIYWISNNLITFSQQYIIMRSHGYTPDILGNIKSSFSRKKEKAD